MKTFIDNFYLKKYMSTHNIKKILAILLLGILGVFIGYKIVQIPTRIELVIGICIISIIPLLKFYSKGIYLLFIVYPFIPFIRRQYYLGYSRPEVDLLIIIPDIILTTTFIGYLFYFKDKQETDPFVSKIKTILTIYIIFLLSRVFIFNSGTIKNGLMNFRFYGPFVFAFFLGTSTNINLKTIKNIGLIIITTSIIIALYGLKQLYWGFSEAENIWLNSITFVSLKIGSIVRPFSTLTSPATFADYMQLSVILAAIYSVIAKNRITKYIMYFLMLLFLYSMLITSVRSSWIGGIVGILVWVFVVRNRGKKARIIGIISILLIFTGLFFANNYIESFITESGTGNNNNMDMLVKNRISAVTNPLEEHSMISRMNLWGMVWRYAINDPLMGIMGRGLGQFRADSLYFTYLAEFGFPGMFFMIYIIYLFISGGLNIYDSLQNKETIAICRGIITMNLIFLVINITGTHIHNFPGGYFFWFWNGVLLRLKYIEKNISSITV